MRFGPHPVKHSDKLPKTEPRSSHWLDGWGLALPSVGIAILAAWLALPRGTMPDYLPLPQLPRGDIVEARRQEGALAEGARAHALSFEARAVGEAFRQLGRLSHDGEPITVERRDRFRAYVQRLRTKEGELPIRQLRAIQAQLFSLALARWEKSGTEDADLVELGGDFLSVASELGWFDPARKKSGSSKPAARRILRLDEDERMALFLARWTDLAGLSRDNSLHLVNTWSILALRARLRLPLARLGQRDLNLIDRVKALVPEYPDLLSKGLLYLRLNQNTLARAALGEHLRMHPDGPLALRARNHLIYTLAQIPADDQ